VKLEVVGAGLGRTGTHTLKVVLEQLVGPTHHMVELFAHPDQIPYWASAVNGAPLSEWGTVLDPYAASVDWPSCRWYAELAEANPDAIVLLSTRASADEWWNSASKTIFQVRPPSGDPWGDAVMKLITDHIGSMTDAETAKAGYERHNAEVRATIPSSRLLEWKATDGWEPICEALGVPVPDEPFPVTNTTAEFQAMMAAGGPPQADDANPA
jgi:hypothetical protein